MIPALFQNQIGALAGGEDVLQQVDLVDLFPDGAGALARLLVREAGVTVEIGGRMAECGVAQGKETLDIPLADVLDLGIYIDGEVEEIGDEHSRLAVWDTIRRLQH